MKTKSDGTAIENKIVKEESDVALLDELQTGYPNVIGITRANKVTQGQTLPIYALVIFVEKKVAALGLRRNEIIPPMYKGEITDVVQIGKIEAEIDRSKRARPFKMGVSGSNRGLNGYCTTGCIFVRKGERVLFGNAHCLCKDPRLDVSKQDRIILQPGAGHGGKHDNNIIGMLISHIQLQEGVPAYNDAAIASLDPQAVADMEIAEVGDIEGVVEIQVGDHVTKSGATTGVTHGQIKYVDVTARVSYRDYEITHLHCVLTPHMSSSGDSGSAGLLLDLDGKIKIWGYLFAGSPEYTIWHKIQNVMSAFELTLPIPDEPEPEPSIRTIAIELIPKGVLDEDVIDVECTVTDAKTNDPVVNALVIVGTPGEGVYTGSDGKALFEDVERKEQVIEVNHEDYEVWKDTILI